MRKFRLINIIVIIKLPLKWAWGSHHPHYIHIIQLPAAAPYRGHLLAVEETQTMGSKELLFTYLIISTGISNRKNKLKSISMEL